MWLSSIDGLGGRRLVHGANRSLQKTMELVWRGHRFVDGRFFLVHHKAQTPKIKTRCKKLETSHLWFLFFYQKQKQNKNANATFIALKTAEWGGIPRWLSGLVRAGRLDGCAGLNRIVLITAQAASTALIGRLSVETRPLMPAFI